MNKVYTASFALSILMNFEQLDYEHIRDQATSAFEHERQWERAGELRQALNDTRLVLQTYTNILAQVADVPHLIGT